MSITSLVHLLAWVALPLPSAQDAGFRLSSPAEVVGAQEPDPSLESVWGREARCADHLAQYTLRPEVSRAGGSHGQSWVPVWPERRLRHVRAGPGLAGAARGRLAHQGLPGMDILPGMMLTMPWPL